MAYVYILQSGSENLYKIGRTRGDVEKRRKDLSTGNPHPLTTFRVIETDHDSLFENFLHKKFAGRLSRRGDAREFYELDPEELEQGLKEAEEFMSGYLPLLEESEKLKVLESSGEVIAPNPEVMEIYQELRELNDRTSILEFEKTVLVNKLKTRIGQADGIEGVATWKTQVSLRFDQTRLKEQEPDLFQRYQSETKQRSFRLQ